MGAKAVGLIHKFDVARTDGSSAPGGKHEGCDYFVLDITHDPIALIALRAYARAARASGYERLADDLERRADARLAGRTPTDG